MNESETDQRKNGVRRMIQPASVLGVSSPATEMIALEQYGSKFFENDATRRWPCAAMRTDHLDHINFSSEIDADSADVSPSPPSGFISEHHIFCERPQGTATVSSQLDTDQPHTPSTILILQG